MLPLAVFFLAFPPARSQPISTNSSGRPGKIDQVNTYEAKGKMKTNVTFLKVPVANITMYFSKAQ